MIIILAGGRRPLSNLLSNASSRSLVRVLGDRLIDYIISSVLFSEEPIVVVSDDENLSRHIEAMSLNNLMHVFQKGSGIEAAICTALSKVSGFSLDTITIIYGDIYSDKEFYRSHIRMAVSELSDIISVTYPLKIIGSYLRLEIESSGHTRPSAESRMVYAGMYTTRSLDDLKIKVCKSGWPLLEFLKARMESKAVLAHQWLGEWVDLDTPWDYLVASRYRVSKLQGITVSDGAKVSETAVIEPPAYIGRNAIVDHYAVIKGPVYIGDRAFIGAHSFIREETVVLPKAIVGAYSEVKRSVIMENSSISSHCYISDSVIGQNSSIGAYTITLSVPLSEKERELALSTSIRLDYMKIGAVITASRKLKEFSRLEPGQTY